MVAIVAFTAHNALRLVRPVATKRIVVVRQQGIVQRVRKDSPGCSATKRVGTAWRAVTSTPRHALEGVSSTTLARYVSKNVRKTAMGGCVCSLLAFVCSVTRITTVPTVRYSVLRIVRTQVVCEPLAIVMAAV
jgi:hypothetical protein